MQHVLTHNIMLSFVPRSPRWSHAVIQVTWCRQICHFPWRLGIVATGWVQTSVASIQVPERLSFVLCRNRAGAWGNGITSKGHALNQEILGRWHTDINMLRSTDTISAGCGKTTDLIKMIFSWGEDSCCGLQLYDTMMDAGGWVSTLWRIIITP
jgi:hypothetical protein